MIVAFDVRCTIIIRIIIVFTSSSWLPGAGHLFPGFPPSTILNYSEFREKFCVLFLFFVYIVCMCKSGPMLSWSLSFVSSITNKFFFLLCIYVWNIYVGKIKWSNISKACINNLINQIRKKGHAVDYFHPLTTWSHLSLFLCPCESVNVVLT